MEHMQKLFPNGLPTLDEIKARNKDNPNIAPETAWIWGPDDELGRINLLTPANTLKARENEILTGQVISLNWPMNLPAKTAFGRDPCKHRMQQHPVYKVVYDDWIDTNIQAGSQWDGFRHFGHRVYETFYNNLKPDEIPSSTRCGIQALSNHGIVGRGVLLDYYGWKIRKGEAYDAFTPHAIHLEELLAVAKDEKVTFEPGDILLVRSGYTDMYYKYEKEDLQRLEEAASHSPKLAGLARTEEIKTWLHDSYFSAVAGDAPSFECWPAEEDPWTLHEFLLSCWGVPIGEMFDLEALAKQCEERQKWSFFFASTPLNMPGGIASLANAIAIV